MLNTIHHLATGRNVLILVALFLIMALGVMPSLANKLKTYAGGENIIDLEMPPYTPERVYDILEAHGEAGRTLYQTFALTADIAYPLIYGLTYMLLLSFLWMRIAPQAKLMHFLPLLGLLGALFDIGENTGIAIMIKNYPTQMTDLAETTAIFSLLKWGFDILSMVFIVVGLFVWLTKLVMKKVEG